MDRVERHYLERGAWTCHRADADRIMSGEDKWTQVHDDGRQEDVGRRDSADCFWNWAQSIKVCLLRPTRRRPLLSNVEGLLTQGVRSVRLRGFGRVLEDTTVYTVIFPNLRHVTLAGRVATDEDDPPGV